MKSYAPPVASQADGTLAQLQILARTHPEILNDPAIQAAMNDPGALQTALQGWQSRNGMDPNGVYDDTGTLQNTSWFDRNLPWITAAMGGAIVAPAAIAALGGGAATSAGSALAGVGPSTAESMAATTAATGAPGGIAATVAGGAGMSIPWSTVNAGVSLFGNLFGAHEQASAAKDAAALTAAAQAKALAFEQAQAENAYQNNEVARKGNYDLYAAQQGRVGDVGQMFGMPARPIPAYVPGVDPRFTGGPTAGQALTGTGPASTSKAAPLTPQIVQQAAQGLDPADPKSLSTVVSRLSAMGYDASVMQNNGAPSDHKVWVNGTPWTFVSSQGYQPGTFKWDPYTQGSTAGSFNAQGMPLGGVPGSPSSMAPTSPSAGSYLAPSSYQSIPVSPGVIAPPYPYGTAGSYLMGAH